MMPFPGAVTDTANATLLLSVLAALLYAFALDTPPSLRRTAMKTLAVALLAVLAVIENGPPFLIAALALSALGDAFLSRDGDRAFLAGLASFLAAHLAYIALFWLAGGSLGLLMAELWRAFAALAMVLFVVLMLTRLWRAVAPDMRVPIAVYVAAIFAMGIAALTLKIPVVTLGAVLFMASDAILAVERFLMAPDSPLRAVPTPVESVNRSNSFFLRNSGRKTGSHFSWNCSRRQARFAVWALYYAAQLAITTGFLLA